MRQTISANGVDLCVETFGDHADPALLLIMGSSGSMDWWRTEFCERLAGGGRLVIRYDHRDTGGSTTSKAGAPDYTGADLVADALGVLDALGIDRAHVAGVSMGGGIAQVLAFGHPERVATLTLIATTAGGDDLPPPAPRLVAHWANPAPKPDWSDRAALIDYMVEDHRPYSGALGFDEDDVRATAASVVNRTRDIEASMTNHSLLGGGDDPLRERLKQLVMPTLVIHGSDDPLFPLPHGEALAREIPHANLLVLDGMGHEAPPRPVWDLVVPALLEHTRGS